VTEALTGLFDGSLLGRDLLRARLGEVIFGVDGVENYEILSPAADVGVEANELPRLGTLRVEAME